MNADFYTLLMFAILMFCIFFIWLVGLWFFHCIVRKACPRTFAAICCFLKGTEEEEEQIREEYRQR